MSKFNTKEMRDAIAKRDGGYFCHYCGCQLIEDNQLARRHAVYIDGLNTYEEFWYEFPPNKKELTVDHVIPQCEGGTHDIENLVLCCRSCNSGRGSPKWQPTTG